MSTASAGSHSAPPVDKTCNAVKSRIKDSEDADVWCNTVSTELASHGIQAEHANQRRLQVGQI